MSILKSETKEESNRQTVRLVKLLTEIGPDIAEIARRLGMFKESVRYKYKEKILKRGFSVHANVNHEALGLKREIYVVDIDEGYSEYANVLFSAMNKMCYLVSFSKTTPDGRYILHESVPEKYSEEVNNLFLRLKEEGFFKRLERYMFDWIRHVPMRAEYYDFDTGRWNFDWLSLPDHSDVLSFTKSGKAKFDYTDLLIIKELQIDANKKLVDVSKKTGINYKKLAWHYDKHVLGGNLINGYRINWLGTRYDYKLERALHRKHRYVIVDIFARATTEEEKMKLYAEINRLPFVWGYASGVDFFCEIAIPIDMFVETLQYIERCTSHIKGRVSFYIVDQTNSLGFTIPYTLYDQERGEWVLDREKVFEAFRSVLIKIREGSS